MYRCDECGATFEAQDVVRKPAAKNISILGYSFLVENSITKKFARVSTDTVIEGDCTLHCPECKAMHPNGFDLVKNTKS